MRPESVSISFGFSSYVMWFLYDDISNDACKLVFLFSFEAVAHSEDIFDI